MVRTRHQTTDPGNREADREFERGADLCAEMIASWHAARELLMGGFADALADIKSELRSMADRRGVTIIRQYRDYVHKMVVLRRLTRGKLLLLQAATVEIISEDLDAASTGAGPIDGRPGGGETIENSG